MALQSMGGSSKKTTTTTTKKTTTPAPAVSPKNQQIQSSLGSSSSSKSSATPKKEIDYNQYTYLNNLAKGNDGNAAWAKAQLENSTLTTPKPASTPAPVKPTAPSMPSSLQNTIKLQTGGVVTPAPTVKQAATNVVASRPSTPAVVTPAQAQVKFPQVSSSYVPTKPTAPTSMPSSLQNVIKLQTGGLVNPAPTVQQAAQNMTKQTPVLPMKPPALMIPPAIEKQIQEQVKNPVTVSPSGQVVPTTHNRPEWTPPAAPVQQNTPVQTGSVAPSRPVSPTASAPVPSVPTSAPAQAVPTTPAPTTQTQAPQQPAQQQPATVWDNPLINEAINLLNGDYSYLDEIARTQGTAAAEEARANLLRLIEELKTNRDFDLRNIENNLSQGRAALEDETFRKYLSLRQNMANRGLGGSGLHQGQDTQLLLGNNRALAGLFQDAGTDIDRVTSQFSQKINNAQQDFANVNGASMSADIYQKLFKEAQDSNLKKAELYAKMFNYGLPYQFPTANNTQNNALEQWKWQNPSANNTQNNMVEWQKWLTPSGNAQLSSQTQLKVADMNNKTRLTLGYANINAQMQRQANDIQMASIKLQNTQWNQQGNFYKGIASQKLNEAKAYLEVLKLDPNNTQAKAGYESAIQQSNMATGALAELAGG